MRDFHLNPLSGPPFRGLLVLFTAFEYLIGNSISQILVINLHCCPVQAQVAKSALGVAAQHGGAHGDLAGLLVLGVDEPEVAPGGGVELLAGEDLEDAGVALGGAEAGEGRLPGGSEEVGEEEGGRASDNS